MILKKWKTKIVPILLAVTLAFPITLFAGCANEKISDYTVEEHIEKVSEKVEARYFADDGKYEYTDYEVHPLYDENEDVAYLLVEFEPYGFIYVWIQEYKDIFVDKIRYMRFLQEGEAWGRYTIVSNAGNTLEEDEKIWEADKTGKTIFYQRSHFCVANITNEKRYLLEITQGGITRYIPAIKKGTEYFNLVSMDVMNYEPILSTWIYPVASISFIPEPYYFEL